jgi:hypothetical protein
MNLTRVAVAAVAAWIVSIPVGFFVNNMVLAGLTAANQAAMRPEAELMGKLPLGLAFLLLGFFAFAYIYAKGYEGGNGIVEGLRFGVSVGALIVGFGVIWQYVLYPISGAMAIAIVIDSMIEAALYGAIVGAIYRPAGHAIRRAATA